MLALVLMSLYVECLEKLHKDSLVPCPRLLLASYSDYLLEMIVTLVHLKVAWIDTFWIPDGLDFDNFYCQNR